MNKECVKENTLVPGKSTCPKCGAKPLLYCAKSYSSSISGNYYAACSVCGTSAEELERMFKCWLKLKG